MSMSRLLLNIAWVIFGGIWMAAAWLVADLPQDDELTPATRDDLVSTLSSGLQFNGRKRTHYANSLMARISVEKLADHLTRGGCTTG